MEARHPAVFGRRIVWHGEHVKRLFVASQQILQTLNSKHSRTFPSLPVPRTATLLPSHFNPNPPTRNTEVEFAPSLRSPPHPQQPPTSDMSQDTYLFFQFSSVMKCNVQRRQAILVRIVRKSTLNNVGGCLRRLERRPPIFCALPSLHSHIRPARRWRLAPARLVQTIK